MQEICCWLECLEGEKGLGLRPLWGHTRVRAQDWFSRIPGVGWPILRERLAEAVADVIAGPQDSRRPEGHGGGDLRYQRPGAQ